MPLSSHPIPDSEPHSSPPYVARDPFNPALGLNPRCRLLDFVVFVWVAVAKLEVVLRQREGEMKEARSQAASLHKQGLSHQARVALARYKKLEEMVGKLRGGVLNLLTLHYSIEGVSADVEIFHGA